MAAQVESLALFVQHKDVPMVSGALGGERLNVRHDLVSLEDVLAAGNVGAKIN